MHIGVRTLLAPSPQGLVNADLPRFDCASLVQVGPAEARLWRVSSRMKSRWPRRGAFLHSNMSRSLARQDCPS